MVAVQVSPKLRYIDGAETNTRKVVPLVSLKVSLSLFTRSISSDDIQRLRRTLFSSQAVRRVGVFALH